jgi:hypothetical protein
METSIKIYHWIPRILCILALLFVSMFSLDAFDPGLSIGQQILGFIMHQIPVFILLALLIVAWKWEYTGGLIFIILGVILSVLVFIWNYKMNHSIPMSLLVILMVTIPFVLVGVLFIVSYSKKRL